MGGLVSYGAYIPYYRLERGKIAGDAWQRRRPRRPLGRRL